MLSFINGKEAMATLSTDMAEELAKGICKSAII